MKKRILGISGSLRAASFNSALLRASIHHLGPVADVVVADIGALPHYNAELDGAEKPASVAQLLGQLENADAVLIVTPEYNYSIPGVLKNAIDWVSRPAYRSPLAHKPTGILGASMSPVGTARAQSHLRQVLGGTVTSVFPHADFLVGSAQSKFGADGELTDQSTRDHLAKYLDRFVEFLDGIKRARV